MSEKADISNVKLIHFAPNQWGELDRFNHFYAATYSFPDQVKYALSGVSGHFHRAVSLQRLASRLEQTLKEDEDELHAKGYSRSLRRSEYAAVIETIFMGLYSVLDCTRQVVGHVYQGRRGITSKSTRRQFQNAYDNLVDEAVPEGIRRAFGKSDWYPEIRVIRDTLTHRDVGFCHRDEKTGKVKYFHEGLKGKSPNSILMEDVTAKCDEFIGHVNEFLGLVFGELNRTLKDVEVRQICGTFGGRIYMRNVRPSEATDFNGGRCQSWEWFEQDEHPTCPFADSCGAYAHRRN